ncbi:hypothetical protein UNDKW_4256 [Undibacterium sp. KW1]|uniref:hypothetical protein n=1 Tax=Undibacterium sp. KW1 TaxID=2058624 RepID=UPI001331C81D|nr:hypothetical protein [Undibacterium sp. KW1]BBB62529.1 hypothetical protein UNDKW_4256 [Undibacterium sp. KW1]
MTEQNNHPSSSLYFELHEHPLVGNYARRKHGGWRADTVLGDLDYPINIAAEGNEPDIAQMSRFKELIALLPEIIASSNLPDAPTEEWRSKHPNYRLLNAKISSLILYEEGSFFVRLDAYPEDDWAPGFDISPDFKVTLAEWGV